MFVLLKVRHPKAPGKAAKASDLGAPASTDHDRGNKTSPPNLNALVKTVMASYQAVNAVLQARYEESTVEQQAASQTMAVPQNEIDDSRASAKVVLASENSGRGNNASSLRDDAVVKSAMKAYHVMQQALQGTCEYINLQYQTNPQAKVAIQAEVDDLRRRLNDADTEIRHHRANSTRISHEKNALCNELNEKHQDVVRANRKCLQSEAAWRSADQRIKNMEGAEKSLRSLNTGLDKRLTDAMDSKKMIEADYATAQEKLANSEEELATLRSEAKDTRERLASVTQSNETTEAKYLSTRMKLETLEASETALLSDNMKLRANLADAAESMETVEASRDEALQESEINRDNWIEAHTARTHFDSVNRFLEGKIQQQDSDVKAMEQRNAHLCEDLDSARSQTDAAQRDLRLRNDEVAEQRYRVSIAPDCHTVAWFNHGIEYTRNENAYDIVCIMASLNETTKTAERETVRMLTSSRDEADRLRREIRALEVAAVESDNATEEAETHAEHLSQDMARLSIKVDQLRKEKDALKVAAEESRKGMEDAQKANAQSIREIEIFVLRTMAQLGAKAHQVCRVGDPQSLDVRKVEKSTEATGNITVESLIEDLSKTLDDLADKMKTSKDVACRAERNRKAAEDGKAEAEKNYRCVQHRLEEVEQSFRGERNQLKIKLEQQIRDLTQNLNYSEIKAQESDELAAAAEECRTAAEHGRQKAESNCRRLQNQLAEVEQSLIDEKNQLQVTTKELGKANQKATQLENDMIEAQTRRNTLETVMEVSQGRLEELKGLRKQLRSHKKQHNAVKLDFEKAKVDLNTMRERVFLLEEASLEEQQRSTASREETQLANTDLRMQLQRYDEVREEERTKVTKSEERARTADQELENCHTKAQELQEALTEERREASKAVEEFESCRAESQALRKALMEEKKETSKAAEELESCRAESLTLEKTLAEEKRKATKREEEAVKLTEDLQAYRSQVQRLQEAENVVASQESNMRSLEETQSLRSEVERRKSAVGQGNTNATTDIEQTNSESDYEVMVIEETEWIEAKQGTKVKPVSKESEQQRSVPQATNKTSSNGNRTMPPPTPTKHKSRMASSTSASDTSSKSPSGASSVSQTESPSALRNPQAANTSSKASTPTKKRAASSDASKLSKDRIASTETTQSSKKLSAPPEAVVTDDENASEPQRPKRIRRPTLKMRPGDAET